MASFLLISSMMLMNAPPSLYTTNFYTGLYAQDDFKVTSRLTLNLGLRWEMETGKHDRFNQLTYFDYGVTSPLASEVGIPDLKGGIRFQHVDAGSPYPASLNEIGPRFGFAYALDAKTAVRGGYGIFFLPYVGQAGVYSAGTAIGAEGYFTQTSWVGSLDGLTPTNYLSNPFPTGLLAPTGNKLGLLTNVGQTIEPRSDRASIHPANVQQWNFTIQRELPGLVLVEAAYVGNKGTHLVDSGWQMDQLTPAQLSLGTSLQQLVSESVLRRDRHRGAVGGAGSPRPTLAALSRQPHEPMAHLRQLHLSRVPAASVEEVLLGRGFDAGLFGRQIDRRQRRRRRRRPGFGA